MYHGCQECKEILNFMQKAKQRTKQRHIKQNKATLEDIEDSIIGYLLPAFS